MKKDHNEEVFTGTTHCKGGLSSITHYFLKMLLKDGIDQIESVLETKQRSSRILK